MKFKGTKGITLIALIITIIVILILVSTSVRLLIGEDGIITQARWADFVAEMTEVKEKIQLKEAELVIQDYADNTQNYTAGIFSNKYNDQMSETLQREINFLECDSNNLYWVEGLEEVKEQTYIYEPTKKIVFKIEGINIFGTTIHSIEYKEGNYSSENPDEEIKTVSMNPEYTKGYYEPNLDGFDLNYTYIIYYSPDFSEYKEIPVQDYLNDGRPATKEFNNITYTFYNYINEANNSVWGNVKTYANGQEAWWVWIPRYAYNSTRNSSDLFDIRFINLDNKVLDETGNTIATIGEDDYTSFILHQGFTEKYRDADGNIQIVKELTGIWMSKYEPSVGIPNETTKVAKCYEPDLTGYDVNNTYIVTYDKTGNTVKNKYLLKNMLKQGAVINNNVLVSGEINTTGFADDEIWYDYANQIWGNIVTKANNIEAWWVWIPRYSYIYNGSSAEFGISFVDINDEPFEPLDDPLNLYQIHPGFNITQEDGTTKKLKGIWMSKYEPSVTSDSGNESYNFSKCNAPNLKGFDPDDTYIVTYDKTGTTYEEHTLKSMLNSYTLDSNGAIATYELNTDKLDTLAKENKIWYDYSNQIWANIITKSNDLVAWWVWIPRYAYSYNTASAEFNIEFIHTENDKPYNENLEDPLELFQVHPGFNLKDGTKLDGIWMSKYEPTGAPTDDELTLPTVP